ncbi:XAC2610-related protein [Pseudomonas fluorescens]|uniref:XAC2610-related protein n=1 Tax=Pseudomonas fluorescens TaxID=294 RepID=UPI003D08770A
MGSRNLTMMLAGLLFGLFARTATAEVTYPSSDLKTTFNPVNNVEATLKLDGSILTISVKGDVHAETTTINFEALNELHVQIDDFNFDGMKDFAVWQIDDGMGTYTIHRIFVYQPEAGSFKELVPACGDGFANLRVESEKRVLLSTYWEMNEPKLCMTNFSPR